MKILTARYVELGSSGTASHVQSDDFSTEKIITSRDIGWDFDIHPSTTIVQIFCSPGIRASGAASSCVCPRVRENLEPPRGSVGGACISDLRHVDVHWTKMIATDGLVGTRSIARLLFSVSVLLDRWQRLLILTWCISTVTVSPAFTAHFPETAPPLTLHRMSFVVTAVTGLFESGNLTQVAPCYECQPGETSGLLWLLILSTPLTQRS